MLTQTEKKAVKKLLTVPLAMLERVRSVGLEEAMDMYRQGASTKVQRGSQEGRLRGRLLKLVQTDFPESSEYEQTSAVDALLAEAFRAVLLESKGNLRLDGRSSSQVRPLTSFADLLPAVHGSSFFKRGDTHVLAAATLGSLKDAKVTDRYWMTLHIHLIS